MLFRKLKKEIGPGVITGSADNDPAGIITYTTAGALYGYATLWVMFLITPLLIVAQEMAARIALVKKKGLATIIENNYGKKMATVIVSTLLLANIATIGADIAGICAVLGMITSTNWILWLIPVASMITYIVLEKKYKVIRSILLGLSIMLIVYILSALAANPNWSDIAAGFVPKIIPEIGFITVVVGLIGTTISPYLLFWQSSEEVEEHKTILRAREVKEDTIIGMVWSTVIAVFIIIAGAETLYTNGIAPSTVENIALALKPIAGELTYTLFAIGVIVSGLLALPVLAGSTAYAVADLMGWKRGLNRKPHLAKGFYTVFVLSIVIGVIIALLHQNPVKLMFYTQVLDGFLTPILIGILLLICNNKKIMGDYTNSRMYNILGMILLVTMLVLDGLLLLTL